MGPTTAGASVNRYSDSKVPFPGDASARIQTANADSADVVSDHHSAPLLTPIQREVQELTSSYKSATEERSNLMQQYPEAARELAGKSGITGLFKTVSSSAKEIHNARVKCERVGTLLAQAQGKLAVADAQAQVQDWCQKLGDQRHALLASIEALGNAGLSSVADDIPSMRSAIDIIDQQIMDAGRDGAKAIQTMEKAAAKAKTPLPEQVAPASQEEQRVALLTLKGELADVGKNSGIDRSQLQPRASELVRKITTSNALTPVDKARLLCDLEVKLHEWALAKNNVNDKREIPHLNEDKDLIGILANIFANSIEPAMERFVPGTEAAAIKREPKSRMKDVCVQHAVYESKLE